MLYYNTLYWVSTLANSWILSFCRTSLYIEYLLKMYGTRKYLRAQSSCKQLHVLTSDHCITCAELALLIEMLCITCDQFFSRKLLILKNRLFIKHRLFIKNRLFVKNCLINWLFTRNRLFTRKWLFTKNWLFSSSTENFTILCRRGYYFQKIAHFEK